MVIGSRAETEVVWNERMHSVHGNKLFGMGKRSRVVIGRGARSPTNDFVGGETPKEIRQPLTLKPPPLCTHRSLCRRMANKCRCPLDSVDLCHQRHVDKPCAIKQIIVGPGWKLRLEAITDRIVLPSKQCGHHSQTDPPARHLRQFS